MPLDESAELTYFPTDVRTTCMLLASLDMEDQEDTPSMVSKLIVGNVLTVAAALQVRDIFHQSRTEQQRRSYDDAIAVSPLINLEMQHDGRSAQVG